MTIHIRPIAACLVNALILASCAANTPLHPIDPLDAGLADAGEDGATTDSGANDTGEDAAVSDSGAMDAGPEDDATIDASTGEVCDNGFDDNGDGRIDEDCACTIGATQSCYPGLRDEVTRGTCRSGSQTCAGGAEFPAWGACTGAVTPTEDLCGDALDQDCNGVVDDGPSCCSAGASEDCYEGAAGTRDVGACHAGTRTCASGAFGACTGAVGPQVETCANGVDENCDGAVDEGCVSCEPQAIRWPISAEEMRTGASDPTGPGACSGTAYCSGTTCSTRPPAGCGSPHCATLRYGDGRTRAEYCSVYGTCTASGIVATGFSW